MLFIRAISSASNTRVERLWVEVGRHFARLWRGFFTRLERNHKLNRKDPEHIWVLQFLFMGEIQRDCDEFRRDWNSHPLFGRGHNRSPLVRLQHLANLCGSPTHLKDTRLLELCCSMCTFNKYRQNGAIRAKFQQVL